MKTRSWIVICGVLFVLCGGLSLWLLGPGESQYAQVICDGEVLFTLDLRVDQERVVETVHGRNVVSVRQGKVAVTEADCPDGYCMQRGWCAGGPQIVCLPNRLVIRFTEGGDVDAMAG